MVYSLQGHAYDFSELRDIVAALRPKKVEILCGKDIKTFVYGNGILALTKEGKVCSKIMSNS
ncbi:hypothetical protein ALC60_10561 [Trachymyrmex zeteki]|uniref:Uncharacterized protein n=1 Tax=Mycetomoellerius zeteki TaxID=64791 RepID=A0A151WRC3_9HYME|nr:hypothetical protein ALC60_10561 [Trachymyrmex zeteki]